MLLVERGEFKLDEPLATQLGNPLNEYESYKESASEIVKDPLWQTVTPRMLLSHSSGLANFAFLEPDKSFIFTSSPERNSATPARVSTFFSSSSNSTHKSPLVN